MYREILIICDDLKFRRVLIAGPITYSIKAESEEEEKETNGVSLFFKSPILEPLCNE